jgi:hypothetical protein
MPKTTKFSGLVFYHYFFHALNINSSLKLGRIFNKFIVLYLSQTDVFLV